MQHLTLADKSLLIGDEVADLLVAYAAVIATANAGDHITVNAFGVDGAQVAAQILLNSGTTLMAESTISELPEPDNAEAIDYLRDRLQFYGQLPIGEPPGGVTAED